MATIAGCSISSISGGKFANGAVTAAMSYAFGEIAQRNSSSDPNEFFEHSTETEIGRPPVPSEMPPEVAEVLGDILKSPLGSKIRSSVHATGEKVKLALTVDAGHAFQVSLMGSSSIILILRHGELGEHSLNLRPMQIWVL